MSVFCIKCGFNIVEESASFCPKCGSQTLSTTEKHETGTDYVSRQSSVIPPSRSNWWYLLPIFLGIIGGLVAYFVLKKDDAKLAKNCLIVGVVMMVLGFIIGAATGF